MNAIKDKILTIDFFIIEIDFAIKFKTNIDFVIEFTIDFVIKIKINFKIEGCYIAICFIFKFKNGSVAFYVFNFMKAACLHAHTASMMYNSLKLGVAIPAFSELAENQFGIILFNVIHS